MADRSKDFPAVAASSDGVGVPLHVQTTAGKPRNISPKTMVSVAIRQAWQSANAGCEFFACGLCRKPLNAYEPRILEHLTARATRIALGLDPDCPSILAWVHKECAAKKTNGNKATCADGDIHKIAKSKRLERAREAHRAVLAGETTREPGKIKHRGFSRVFRKKMNGSVVPR